MSAESEGPVEAQPVAQAVAVVDSASSVADMTEAAIRAHNVDADEVRAWFNAELDKLEERKARGIFTDAQLESEVQQLMKERDLKLSVVASRTLKSQPMGRTGCRLTRKRKTMDGNNAEDTSKSKNDDESFRSSSRKAKASKGKQGPPGTPGASSANFADAVQTSGAEVVPLGSPSVATWWTPTPKNYKPPQAKPAKRKRGVDSRIQNPGSGKRGREKRTPRQFRFKWEVIQTYERFKGLKGEGKMDDPCMVTARMFSINKSQVSAWWRQRAGIREKVGDLSLSSQLPVEGAEVVGAQAVAAEG